MGPHPLGSISTRAAGLMAAADGLHIRDNPGLFHCLGVLPKGADPKTAPVNHSPLFFADEAALPTGVRSLANLAVDYLKGGALPKGAVQ